MSREPISSQLRDFVLERDGYCCRYCGSKIGPFHLDHVYPVSRGGETTKNNLVTSCEKCNLSKHSSVGLWPKPIGYFDKHKRIMNYVSWAYFLSMILSILMFAGSQIFKSPLLVVVSVFFLGMGLLSSFLFDLILK